MIKYILGAIIGLLIGFIWFTEIPVVQVITTYKCYYNSPLKNMPHNVTILYRDNDCISIAVELEEKYRQHDIKD